MKQVQMTSAKPDFEMSQWYAVYTAFRSEKQVASQLRKKNVEVYLPLISKTKRYMRKLKTYQVPMLGCYLFVKINRSQTIKVLETERVIKIISERGQPCPIREEEINFLKRIEGLDMEIEQVDCNFSVGDTVVLKSGSLAGMNGRLLKKAGKKSFIVELETLGVSLKLSIDTALLSKINSVSLLTD